MIHADDLELFYAFVIISLIPIDCFRPFSYVYFHSSIPLIILSHIIRQYILKVYPIIPIILLYYIQYLLLIVCCKIIALLNLMKKISWLERDNLLTQDRPTIAIFCDINFDVIDRVNPVSINLLHIKRAFFAFYHVYCFAQLDKFMLHAIEIIAR